MNNESQWPEDKADWPQTASVVQGGVVSSAKPAQSYGKTHQVTVEQLAKLQERCDELLKQRDELLAACLKTLIDNSHLADGDNCTLIDIKLAIHSVKGGAE